MTALSPTFLVFDIKTGPMSVDLGLFYCILEYANVQWLKCAKRKTRNGGLYPFYDSVTTSRSMDSIISLLD